MESFDCAIKVYKTLKNWARKWQSESLNLKGTSKSAKALYVGTGNFSVHVMTTYSQIGHLYRHLGMHESSTDYFKKQLFNAWLYKSTEQEYQAYHNLAIQYFYMDNDPENLAKAVNFSERAARGLMEENRSSIKKTWIAIQKSKDLANFISLDGTGAKNEADLSSNKFIMV